jgi:hypothetical protein
MKAGKMKFYERGSADESKEETGCLLENIDRIRFGFTANRGDLIKMYGPGSINLNFINNPKFSSMLKGKFFFRKFKKASSSLVPEDEKYRTKDKFGNKNAFQQEYLAARQSTKNIAQHMDGVKKLKRLFARLVQAMDGKHRHHTPHFVINISLTYNTKILIE